MKRKTMVDNILKCLREQGHKITSTRRRIVEVFTSTKEPLSADDVFEKVAHFVDRATVYRTIALLEKAKILSRFTFGNKHVYELASQHNHYLVCKQCDRVEKINICTIDDIEKKSLRASKDFALLERHTLQLLGLCKRCSP